MACPWFYANDFYCSFNVCAKLKGVFFLGYGYAGLAMVRWENHGCFFTFSTFVIEAAFIVRRNTLLEDVVFETLGVIEEL